MAVAVGEAEVQANLFQPFAHRQVPRLRTPLNGVAPEIVGGIEPTPAAAAASTAAVIITVAGAGSYEPFADFAVAFPHGVPGRADTKRDESKARSIRHALLVKREQGVHVIYLGTKARGIRGNSLPKPKTCV